MDYIEVLVGVISALISSIVLIWWGMRICKKDITINECSEIIHMFCDECKRATLLIGGRLRIDKISYKNSTFPFRFQAWLSANAFNM